MLLFSQKNFMFSFALLLVLVYGVNAQISVYALVDESKEIYANNRFNYNIVIDGDNKAAQVDISSLENFDPQGPSERNLSQKSISIVNGKRSVNQTKRYIMTYSIVAPKAGNYEIAPVNVTIDGKKFVANAVTFSVLAPATTDRIALEADLSKTQCYVGEPVVLQVRWYIWQTVAQAKSIGNFEFYVPAFQEESFILDDAFSGSPNSKPSIISGTEATLYQQSKKYNGVDCLEVSFEKVIIPQSPGSFDLENVSISTQIAVGRRNSRDSFFGDMFSQKDYKIYSAKSSPLTLEVLPLPQAKANEESSDLVGDYAISAQATPSQVKVGDPVTLKIIVTAKYLKAIDWSDLRFSKKFEENFIIPEQSSSPKIVNGEKVFIQTIRAKTDLVSEIPPITINFFDATKGHYGLAKTKAIPLKVSPNKTLTLADVEGISNEMINASRDVKAAQEGVSANLESMQLLKDERFSLAIILASMPFLFGGVISILVFIASVIARIIRSSDPNKKALRIQRQAASKAIKAINCANKLGGEEAKVALANAMLEYVAQRFSRRSGSVTSQDCYAILCENLDEQDASQYSSVIEKCQASTYSSLKANYDTSFSACAIEIIKKNEKAIK